MKNTKRLPIRLRFPVGIYAFWLASRDKDSKRIVFRVKITGTGGSRTPQERINNAVKECRNALDFESAERFATFRNFRHADLTAVTRWLAGHGDDLYDLVDQIRIKP